MVKHISYTPFVLQLKIKMYIINFLICSNNNSYDKKFNLLSFVCKMNLIENLTTSKIIVIVLCSPVEVI